MLILLDWKTLELALVQVPLGIAVAVHPPTPDVRRANPSEEAGQIPGLSRP
jgi:hypothetical protein